MAFSKKPIQLNQAKTAMNTAVLLLALADCTTFEQADQRAYCRALAQHNSGECYSIRDADLRTQCRAELFNDKSQCYSVTNPTDRAECQMRSTQD